MGWLFWTATGAHDYSGADGVHRRDRGSPRYLATCWPTSPTPLRTPGSGTHGMHEDNRPSVDPSAPQLPVVSARLRLPCDGAAPAVQLVAADGRDFCRNRTGSDRGWPSSWSCCCSASSARCCTRPTSPAPNLLQITLPPSSQFPLGTDPVGYNVLGRLMVAGAVLAGGRAGRRRHRRDLRDALGRHGRLRRRLGGLGHDADRRRLRRHPDRCSCPPAGDHRHPEHGHDDLVLGSSRG